MNVLFVCLGNICRSPTAEGVFRKMAEQSGLTEPLEIDSAGTHDFNVGRSPDSRSIAHAARRGYDLTALRARAVTVTDFENFDYVIAMDSDNVAHLTAICPAHHRKKIQLLLDYAGDGAPREIPDPYQGGAKDFELVLDLVERGCRGLVEHIFELRRVLAERRNRSPFKK
jgi:protein-tyrosine phosphatase